MLYLFMYVIFIVFYCDVYCWGSCKDIILKKALVPFRPNHILSDQNSQQFKQYNQKWTIGDTMQS